MTYKLFCLVSVLSDGKLSLLLGFVFLIGYKVLDAINVCCCCLILLFVLTRFLNNGRFHQPKAAFFTPLIYLSLRRSICSYTNFY